MAMNPGNHDPIQIDRHKLQGMPEEQLFEAACDLLDQLKEAHELLRQNSKISFRTQTKQQLKAKLGAKVANDIVNELGCYQLYTHAERDLWKIDALPWHKIDKSQVSDQVLQEIKIAAYGELTTFSATQSFMRMFSEDIDLSQWLAVWFYEETKHPYVLIKWLSYFDIKIDEAFIREGRKINPMTNSAVEMLTFNIISEIIACNTYLKLSNDTTEPLLKEIAKNLARDEMRHSRGFEYYCKKYIENSSDPLKEQLVCLKTLWFFLERIKRSLDQKHPVLISLEASGNIFDDNFWNKVNIQIAIRFSKMLDVQINEVGEIYGIYLELKRAYTCEYSQR